MDGIQAAQTQGVQAAQTQGVGGTGGTGVAELNKTLKEQSSRMQASMDYQSKLSDLQEKFQMHTANLRVKNAVSGSISRAAQAMAQSLR
ncbi:MAG: hypothetical protein KAH22_01825 [Thiotrichaceae bacterium]|nr:hypothetical protein [Thiotrichaceae bacterium]